MGAIIAVAFALAVMASYAQAETPQAVVDAAQEAGVDPVDLAGAVDTTGLEPREYLYQVGELGRPYVPSATRPAEACAWPVCGPLGQRLYCQEGVNGHRGTAWNPVGMWIGGHVEHAQGWLDWMPTTANAWGAIIGDRWSEWQAGARMIIAGQGNRFWGIAAGRC
jgi:hypothetical protein